MKLAHELTLEAENMLRETGTLERHLWETYDGAKGGNQGLSTVAFSCLAHTRLVRESLMAVVKEMKGVKE